MFYINTLMVIVFTVFLFVTGYGVVDAYKGGNLWFIPFYIAPILFVVIEEAPKYFVKKGIAN